MTETIIIAGIFALIVGVPIFSLARRRQRANAARNAAREWPAVSGRIITSQLQRVYGSGSLTSSSYRAVIWYEYWVEGQQYTNNVVDIGDILMRKNMPTLTFLTRVNPEEAVRRFPEGATVQVFVDPTNPKNSCLER